MKIVAILYPGGETARNNPDLLGCAENALGLRDFLERDGHELVVLTDKESEPDKHFPTTDILITTPFWPAYITKDRILECTKASAYFDCGCGLRSHRFGGCCCHTELPWLRLQVATL